MSEDGEDVHAMEGLMVKHMDQDIRTKLANCLDPKTVACGNWTNLAGKLDYSYVEIMALEARQSDSGSNTQKLLAHYGLQLNSTVSNLKTQLEAINRQDAVEELENAIPDIREAYRREEQQTSLPVWSPDGHQPPSSRQICTSCPSCNSQPEYYRFNSAPSGTPHRHHTEHCRMHRSCNYGQRTQTNGHSSCQPSHKGRYRTASSPVASMNYQPCPGYSCGSTGACMSPPKHHRTRPQLNPTNSSIVSCRHKVNDKIQNVNPKEYHSMVSMEDNNVNCSLEVHHAHSHIRGRQGDFTEPSSSSLQSYVHSDPPLPLHEGILRCLHNPLDNVPPLMAANNLDVGAEEEVFTSSDSSTSSNSYQGIVFENPTDIVSQQNQSSGPLRCGKTSKMSHPLPRSNSQSSDYSVCHKKQSSTIMAHTNGHMTGLKISKSELKMVENSGSHPSRLVHSHSVDKIKSSSSSSAAAAYSPHHVQKQPLMHMRNSRESPSNGAAAPKRVKPKLSEVCRGEVKVFVTYAAHSQKHREHVIDLYNCLKKNGFSPYLDCHDNELFEDEAWEHFFQRADFVLICVSPLYKSLTMGASNQNGVITNFDPLHTRHIFDLMRSEFRNDSQNRRLIPLIFRGATQDHVPSWLQNTLIYKWPEHFRDLLWKLTKPQERVSPCARR